MDWNSEIQVAARDIQAADYLLTSIFPSVKDPKILLSVIHRVHTALSHTFNAILVSEEKHKITATSDSFVLKCTAVRKLSRKYKQSEDIFEIADAINEIVETHMKSPIEFPRNEAFIICSDEYEMKKVTFTMLKNYIDKAKSFIYNINIELMSHES